MIWYWRARKQGKLRHFIHWRWNMLVDVIMRVFRVWPWYDPEYDAWLAEERAETAEFLAALAQEKPQEADDGRVGPFH